MNISWLLFLANLTLIIGIYWPCITYQGWTAVQVANGERANVSFKSPCGTAEQVSRRLGICVSELIDLAEGRVPEPKSDADVLDHLCGRFDRTERCARSLAKECFSVGLHRTSTNAVASATKHWRRRECDSVESRARYFEPMRCLVKSGPEMRQLHMTSAGVLQGIRDMVGIEPEFKFKKVCCMLERLDKKYTEIYDKNCPQHTSVLQALVRTMSDDLRKTLCARPRCNATLGAELEHHKYTPPQNLVEPAMQVVFQMSSQ